MIPFADKIINGHGKTALAELYWDGDALQGDAEGRDIRVLVPARLVSFRSESFPAAERSVLHAAIRLRAGRLFAALGEVRIDAIIGPAGDGQVPVLLMALPLTVLTAIAQVAEAQSHRVRVIAVAELSADVPAGGLCSSNQDAVLLAYADGFVQAVSVLGDPQADGFDAHLQRERQRLQMPADASGGPLHAAAHNFLEPQLEAKAPLLQRRRVRVALALGTIVGLLLLTLLLAVHDRRQAFNQAQQELLQIQPLAEELQQRRTELKDMAQWFDARQRLSPSMAVMARHLPPLNASEQVFLTRLRQLQGRQGVIEGVAHDRAALLQFIERLRADPLLLEVTLRNARNQDKRSQRVSFELMFQISEAAVEALSAAVQEAGDAKP